MLRQPPSSKRTYTLFPYPTLFRSRRAEFHRLRRLRDHRARDAGDAPHAEHAVALRVGDHLHEAVGLVVGLGAAVRHHRELADLDLTAFLRLPFGQADTGDSGPGVDYRRDDVMVHDAGQPGDILGAGDALTLGFMRHPRPRAN